MHSPLPFFQWFWSNGIFVLIAAAAAAAAAAPPTNCGRRIQSAEWRCE